MTPAIIINITIITAPRNCGSGCTGGSSIPMQPWHVALKLRQQPLYYPTLNRVQTLTARPNTCEKVRPGLMHFADVSSNYRPGKIRLPRRAKQTENKRDGWDTLCWSLHTSPSPSSSSGSSVASLRSISKAFRTSFFAMTFNTCAAAPSNICTATRHA